MKNVLDYATSVIASEKILMGVTLYGYDWPIPWRKGLRAASLSNNSAQNLAINEKSPIRFDPVSASPNFEYTNGSQSHQVWFDDALSISAKFSLIDEYQLRGLSWWVLGNSFPQGIYLMSDVFNIRKVF
ncbi:glycosyl hydrolase family 18 protein [Alicyclobacillus tolerans]|uniref:glycosyl hydrolase family 18 protein n=1 Tax=Alicyclobacillus tolerans TaxID=90970 RepID=UPI00101AE5FC|nr:glycoside hydrolase [Alicyclobacillus montanus]